LAAHFLLCTSARYCRKERIPSLKNVFLTCAVFAGRMYGRYSVQKVLLTRSELARKKLATSALTNIFNLEGQPRRTATWPCASSEILISRNPSSFSCTGHTVAERKVGFGISKFRASPLSDHCRTSGSLRKDGKSFGITVL
jgi:hypothetical protein